MLNKGERQKFKKNHSHRQTTNSEEEGYWIGLTDYRTLEEYGLERSWEKIADASFSAVKNIVITATELMNREKLIEMCNSAKGRAGDRGYNPSQSHGAPGHWCPRRGPLKDFKGGSGGCSHRKM